MTRSTVLAAVIALSGCATAPVDRGQFTLSDGRRTRILLSEARKKVPAATREEAEAILRNQREYLKSFYHQSIEPYQGTPRLSELCLKENRIGDVQVDAGGGYFVADVYASQTAQPGLCSDAVGARRTLFLVVSCWKDGQVAVIPRVLDQAENEFALSGSLRCE